VEFQTFDDDERTRADAVPHGGVIEGDFTGHAPDVEAVMAEIRAGLAEWLRGTGFARDVEPVPGAPIQMMEYFDTQTGKYCWAWRVNRREKTAAPQRVTGNKD
jgi:hypothetical protein